MPELSPDEVASRTFPTSFRGFDPGEVKIFLARVADQLRTVEAKAEELAQQVREATDARPALDVDALTSALGEETARIVRSAQEAAADIRAKAEENVAQLLREAYEEAGRIRAEAELVLARETETAEAAAAELRADAEAEAAGALGRARKEAERVLADVETRARAMIEEAQSGRARILGDLARRRKLAHTQVEQLRAGRERLLESYRMVRTTLDEVTDGLVRAEAEARAAAEAAARRVSDEPVEGDPLDVEDDAAAPAAEPDVEAEVAPEPTPEPEPEKPRLSSVRIIRRPKPEAEPEREPEPEPEAGPEAEAASEPEPVPGFVAVEPAPTDEAVRVFKPEPEPVPEPPLPEEEAAPEPSPVDDLFARIREEAEPEVESAPEPEPAPEEAAEAEGAPDAEAEPEEAPVPDADETLLQRRDQVVDDIEQRLARRLKRALQDEQNDVLDRLRSHRGTPTSDAVLPSADEQFGRYRVVAVELLEEAAQAGARFVEADATPVPLDDLADSLAADLVSPLRRRLEHGLQEGAGEDTTLLVERIGAAYRETKGKRIEQLAADHVIAAFSRGTFHAVEEGTPMRWIVDDVGGPCPDCDDNALAGPTPRGEEYPTGRPHPPAHGGCRCLLAPAAQASAAAP